MLRGWSRDESGRRQERNEAALVASAVIDFGEGPGAKTWVPPTVIDFPLVLRHYP